METAQHLSALQTILSRHRLLEEIANGVRQKRDLNDNLDSSRTTIDRAVRELENENILRRGANSGCEFTRFGRLAYEEFCRASETFQSLSQASELLAILPEESPLDLTLLNGANIKLANQRAPVAPFQQFTADAPADQIQAMLPVLFPQQLEFLCNQADAEADIQLLIHQDLLTIIEEDYPDGFDDLTRDSVHLNVSSNLPQFGLTVIDSDTVWVSIHRQNGGLYGLFENSHDHAVTHATNLFSHYLDEGQKPQQIKA